MTFIMVGVMAYPTDTDAEIENARRAMLGAGMTDATVYAGDADGDDSYPNGQILFANEV